MTIHQLIYTSRATRDITDSVLLEILSKAQVKNNQLKLSGILIFHKGAFIQLLEGSERNVKDLFESISKDTRHTDIKILSEIDSPERSMPSWFMGFSASGDESLDRIRNMDFHIPFDETRQICELMEGEMRKVFLEFLNA